MTSFSLDSMRHTQQRSHSFKFFVPILSGATLHDRIIACFGALLGIGLTALICGLGFNGLHMPLVPLLVAPMGASAVLLFAVPASPLAQPWSIVGGNTISALVGVTVVHFIPDPIAAAALAVALAIGAMSLFRCLHPPGGAAALTAVLGGPAVLASGYMFAFVPVALDSAVLVLCGWLFHKLSRRHAYPHIVAPAAADLYEISDAPSQKRIGFRSEDVDKALEDLGETLDIDRRDLDHLLRRVELNALNREHDPLTCADIMSRDVIHISLHAAPSIAQHLLLAHSLQMLPVVDDRNRVVGSVGFRHVLQSGKSVKDIMSEISIVRPDVPALDLLDGLTRRQHQGVVIADEQRRLLGVVTQTDLLIALSRPGVTSRPQA